MQRLGQPAVLGELLFGIAVLAELGAIMVVATTMATPPLLLWSMRRSAPSQETA